jgi:N-acetylmuramoyl-L-alanine amidase-like protein/flagellar hook capping protein FlgD
MKAPLVAIFFALALPGVARAELASLESRDVPLGARTVSGISRTPRFNLVGMHWNGSGEIAFRTRSLTGHWSRWRQVEAESGVGRGARRFSDPYWTGASDRIEYRRSGDVRRLRTHFVWSPVEAAPVRTLSLAGAPLIIPRSAWGANELIKRGTPRFADRLGFAVVHHTAGSNTYSRAQSAAIVRAIEVYHVQANGWNDLGYNFLVDKYGQVFEGRAGGVDRNVIGAHAEGFNTGSAGVAVLGNYQTARLPVAAETALTRVLAWRLDVAHVDPASTFDWITTGNPRFRSGVPVFLRAIVGHRDVGFTECPGSAIYSRFGPLVQAVAHTGLPKLYGPSVSGRLGGRIVFGGTLSSALSWTVSVLDSVGRTVASGGGAGTRIAWAWDSTAAPAGTYTYAIEATGVRPARGSLGRKGTVTQLLSAAGATPSALTPNGDGRDDFATISYTLAARATVTATVTDANGLFVTNLFTEARPAGLNTYVFDPRMLPDGAYTITLSASDSSGRAMTASIPVSVNLIVAALTAGAEVFSPNGDGRLDTLELRFELAAPGSVRLRVLKDGKWIATVFEGPLASGPQAIAWDGRKRIGRLLDGSYEAELSIYGYSQRVPFRSDSTRPRLRVLRLRPLRLWLSEPAEVVLTIDGNRRRVRRDRAGAFAVLGRRPHRVLHALARDAAGNASKPLVEKRYR